MAGSEHHLTERGGSRTRNRMALDLQQQSAQHDNMRHHNRYEAENERVTLQSGAIDIGAITRVSIICRDFGE